MKHLLTLLLFISTSAIAADMDSIVNNEVIDLNDIEWTRSVIRTLSTLNHPRTLELISILAVHESPALQKELKAAVERLERK